MDALTYSRITETAMNALRSDEALRGWCLECFGRAPMVLNDVDPMQPPEERECPLVAVMSVGGGAGQERGSFRRGLLVRCAVYDPGITEEKDAGGNTVWRDYRGARRVTDMLENYVYPCLRRAFNALNYPLSTEDEELEPSNLGLFQVRAGISVIFDTAIGEERPYL
jgi:hypothetical protein